MRLEDKVALITGGGSGIGRAAALRLAREGARIVVTDCNAMTGPESVEMVKTEGGTAMFVHADISHVADTERVVREAARTYGELNILVNCAGVVQVKLVTDTTEADWDRIVGVNLKGTFFCSKHAILEFRRQGHGGAIVNIASINAVLAEGSIAAYCATKGGIVQLTRALAMDHSGEGIRVNSICPGWIDTPMNDEFFALGPHIREEADRLHAIGRIGQPEEVANTVAYLVSDEASFITGATVAVDGGLSAGLAPSVGVDLSQAHR